MRDDLLVLEPYLNGPLRHVDFLCDTLANGRSRGRVFVELDFQQAQLVLGGPLALLVLLLLSQGTLARGPTRLGARAGAIGAGCR